MTTSAVSGPRYGWQAVDQAAFSDAVAQRKAELAATPEVAHDSTVFAEAAALDAGLDWARGRGLVETVFTGIEAIGYVCYSISEATFVLRRGDGIFDTLAEWADQGETCSFCVNESRF